MSTTKKELLKDAYNYSEHQASSGVKNLDEYKNLVNQKTSALSNLGQANKVAMKYADNTALAQGYATQGAMLQNNANLQNTYMNQVGGVNQQFQQQLGNLKNTASENALTNYTNRLADIVNNPNLTSEQQQQAINNLQNAYYGQMDANAIKTAQFDTESVIHTLTNTTPNSVGTNELTGNNVYTTNNGAKYETNVGSGWHSDFTYTIGTKEYKVELGSKINDSSFDPNSIKVGEITTYVKDGTTYLVTKDSSGIVRYVKNRTGTVVGIDNDSGNGGKVSAKGTNLYELALALGLNPQQQYQAYKSK